MAEIICGIYKITNPSGKIRKHRSNEWVSDALSVLNKDFNNNIPARTINLNNYNSVYITFGKFKGCRWSSIKKSDSQYIDWLLQNTKDEKLKQLIKKATEL